MAKQDNSAFNTVEGLHKHTHIFARKKKNQSQHFNLKYVLTKTRQVVFVQVDGRKSSNMLVFYTLLPLVMYCPYVKEIPGPCVS